MAKPESQPGKSKDILRTQMDVTPEGLAVIEQLMITTGTKTKKELFNTAFTLMGWMVNERQQGRIIASVNEKTGAMKEIVMSALEAASPKKNA